MPLSPDKFVYLVRHGQSVGNLENIFQDESSPLSENGIRQSKKLALRFRSVPIDLIVAASTRRALETAQIIAKRLGKRIVESSLFVEVRKPSIFFGRKVGENIAMLQKWRNDFFAQRKVGDGETYRQVLKRASEALEFLENIEAHSILVVTHSSFLRVLMALAVLEDEVTPQIIRKLWLYSSLSNTGISAISYYEKYWDGSPRWVLETYNDSAHL